MRHSALLLPGLAVLCAGALAACDARRDVRTHPGLLDLPSATVAEVNTTATAPGRYNVRATVVQVNACSCPPGALCEPCPPDGVLVSESGAPPPPDGIVGHPGFLYVVAENPGQFETGRRYVLSVEVGDRRVPLHGATLLGYAPAR